MLIESRLDALRKWMKAHDIMAYAVPTADPHNNEFLHPHYKCREWLSGFTGSAGLLVVTPDDAALWVDSRYTLQAKEQMGFTSIKLMRDPHEEKYIGPWLWVTQKMTKFQTDRSVVHCPGTMLSLSMVKEAKANHVTILSAPDAFDEIWTDRPQIEPQPITRIPNKYIGGTITHFLEKAAKRLKLPHPGHDFIFNDLCDIAYLLNLRGHDIPYTPVFFAYLLYKADEERFILFTHGETLTEEALAQLEKGKVEVRPYDEAMDFIRPDCMYDPATATQLIADRAVEGIHMTSPAVQLRYVKNDKEQAAIRTAMINDGVAMITFLRELEQVMQIEGMVLTETDLANRLLELRARCDLFIEPSFPTIAAYASNGAIVHYEPEEKTARALEPRGLLLLDSGGQYECGTTDITRTISLGPVTAEESRAYTLVLKCHLALARLRFPENITGAQVDAVCRHQMWAQGFDFGHGTGHGVGMHLCVHEGPMQIRKEVREDTLIAIKPGVVVTNEPGIYVQGKFGVRIENTMVCRPWQSTKFGNFLFFDQLTLCPYDLRPVDFSMITEEEVMQINDYHALVRDVLMPYLTEPADQQYLEWATQPIV